MARRRRSTVSMLYKMARMANDIQTLSSGNPRRISRRVRNKLLGRYVVSKLWRM